MVLSKFQPNLCLNKKSQRNYAVPPFLYRTVQKMSTFVIAGAVGAAAVVGLAILCNLEKNPFVKVPVNATLDYLASTKLQTFNSHPREFLASELWDKNGAIIMVVRRAGCRLCREEALGLAALRFRLDGVPLYAIVHEDIGINEFKVYFRGEIFLDKERRFYGPVERTMLWSGLLRLSVWKRIFQSQEEGDFQGEGRILGGLFVIGSGRQGILLEHRESEFGDFAKRSEVLEAALKIQPKSMV
ncbi:redox-regulatory protein FAM213A [Elysia marginata]|uniref:Peroxiredoxin-like 2A n=1 Tax=Elysia marginata TaxID=1093978 RepID=A0AAV4HQ23_9GAST|nr:redox-regulatory protein FAM213A [Elysia marginata]